VTTLLLVTLVTLVVLGIQPRSPTYPQRTGRTVEVSRSAVVGGLVVLTMVGIAAAPLSAGLVAVPVLALVIGAGRWLMPHLQERRRQVGRRQMVLEVCDALSAELRTGLPSGPAVAHACTDWPELEPVVATAQLGGGIPEALRTAAHLPGAEALRLVAAGWEVSQQSGAALAGVLDQLGAGLRDEEEVRAEVEASLGPPRATARMLAVLPLMGIALGASIGADPLGFLFGTPLGIGCLGVGAVLAGIGVWWVERLARAVEA